MEPEQEPTIEHIGIKRKSGRYPWGSGANPLQRSQDFKKYYNDMKKKDPSLTPAQIAQGLGLVSTDLRAAIAVSTAEIYAANRAKAVRMSEEDGWSNVAIAKAMGTNESTVRGWLKGPGKKDSILVVGDVLRENVAKKPFLEVGKGTELYMGISDTKLRMALAMLRDEGYQTHQVWVPQLGTDKFTEHRILTDSTKTLADAKQAVKDAQYWNINDQSTDGGFKFMKPGDDPVSVSSKRINVRYDEDGGSKLDGVIELRRGVPDLDLGGKSYAQVRVAVDGTHYLKGMAIYADDLPAGQDIRFNTNKSKSDAPNKVDVMKPMDLKPEAQGNRFGASTYPKMYIDKNGKEQQSSLNVVGTKGRGNEEGRWDQWSKSLSSQMLSKQSVVLANTQLSKTRAKKEKELNEIMRLTNPIVKKRLLEEFAENADSAATHLKAAALDRQSSHVLLPMNSMRPNEIFAPNFTNGEKVVLIRYPHGGPFEIPELTVNNLNRTAQKIMGGAQDAVGIHHTVANQLSGADFDGDAVLVIPNDSRKVKTRPPLAELETFDPKKQYAYYEGMDVMTKRNTQTEMGKISNLITDMTIKGANDREIAKAVKHSMVVIDAEKHKLNYKQSAIDNDIAALKKTYQNADGKRSGGASTIISKASSTEYVPERKLRKASDGGPIDPKTGELVYVPTGATRIKSGAVSKRTGIQGPSKEVPKTTKVDRMDATKDAHTLTSKNPEPMENVYANHANAMKSMANAARKESVRLPNIVHSPAAKALYAPEVASLKAKLQQAQRNAPLERKAQVIGNAAARARIDANPHWEKDDIKKAHYKALEDARQQTGANKQRIGGPDVEFSLREWAAVQAGAISSTMLREILNNSDMKRVRELATPRARTALTPGQLAKAKSMQSSGRSMSEIVEALGLPRSTIADNLANG